MNESRAWIVQAQSDFALGNRMVQHDSSALCHVIANFQQAVEKAVKGLVVALNSAKIHAIQIGRRHEVEPYVSAMVRLRRSRSQRSLRNAIQRLFSSDIRRQIRDLDALAPKWPAPGELPSRNTEYPYQDSARKWRAPAELEAFDRSEADSFRHLAGRIVDGCGRIISAIERGPR